VFLPHSNDAPSGPIFACLTPAVMPSLHALRLEQLDISSAACKDQLTAALREGALIHVKVSEQGLPRCVSASRQGLVASCQLSPCPRNRNSRLFRQVTMVSGRMHLSSACCLLWHGAMAAPTCRNCEF
jgi:hypothetical protein